jgi:hypothetical protein
MPHYQTVSPLLDTQISFFNTLKKYYGLTYKESIYYFILIAKLLSAF